MMTTEAAAASPDSPLPQHHQSQLLEQRYSYILPVLAPIHPAAAPTPNITTAAVAAAAATMHGVSPTSAVAAPSAPASGGGVFVGPYSDSVDVHHEQQQHQQQQLQLQLQLLQQQQQQQQQQQFLQLQYHQQQQNLLLLQQQLLQQQQQDPQPQSSTFAAPGLPAPNIMPFYLYQLPQQSPINPYPFAQGPSGPATGMMAVSSPMLPTAIPLQMGPQLMATPVPGSPISYLAPNSTISKRPSLAPSVATSVISTDVVVSAGSTTNQYMSQQQTQDAKRAPSIISLPSSTIASSRPASVLRSSSIIEHTRAYHPQPLPTLPEENSVRSTTPEVPIANSRANSRSYFFYPDSLQHGHDSKGSVPSVTALPRTTTVPPGNSFVVPPMSMSPLPETPLTATPLTETPPTPVMDTPPLVAESTAAVLSDRSVPSVAESMERAISSPAVSPPASRPTSPISTESVLLLSPSTSPSILANSVLTVKHLGKKAKRSVILCAPKTNDDIISVRNTIAMMERAKHLSALDDALAFGSEEGVSRDSSFFPVRLGSNAAMRGGRDSEIELYGHLAYAALTGDALIILGTGTRTYIHISRISSVLNESDLSTPCHFAIDIDKLHYRFSSHSSPDYQNWIQKLTAEFDKTHCSETSSSADITVTPRERVPLNARTEKGERQRGESSFSPVASEARQKKPAPEKRRSRSNSRPSPPDSRSDGHRKRSNSNPRPKESKMSDASLESLADRKQPGSPPSMSRALPRSRSATLSAAVKGHGNIEEEAKDTALTRRSTVPSQRKTVGGSEEAIAKETDAGSIRSATSAQIRAYAAKNAVGLDGQPMRSSLHSGRTVDRPPSSLREVVTNGATSSDTDGLASPTRIESDESVPEGIPIGVENTGQESTPMVNPPAGESKALADVLPKKHSLGHAFSSIGAGSNSPTSTRSSSPTMSERRRQGVSTRQGSTVRFSVFDETFQINDLSPPSDDVPVAVIPGAAVTGEEHISKKYRAEASGEFTRVKRLSEDDQSSDDDKPLGLTSGKLPADTENGADAVKPDEEEAVGRPRMIRTPSRQSTSSNSSTKVLSDRIPVAGAASRRHSYLPSTSTTPPPIRTDPRTYRNSMYGEGSPTASLSLERSRSHSSMIGGRGSKDSLGGRSLSSTGTGRAPTAGETAVNSLPRRSKVPSPEKRAAPTPTPSASAPTPATKREAKQVVESLFEPLPEKSNRWKTLIGKTSTGHLDASPSKRKYESAPQGQPKILSFLRSGSLSALEKSTALETSTESKPRKVAEGVHIPGGSSATHHETSIESSDKASIERKDGKEHRRFSVATLFRTRNNSSNTTASSFGEEKSKSGPKSRRLSTIFAKNNSPVISSSPPPLEKPQSTVNLSRSASTSSTSSKLSTGSASSVLGSKHNWASFNLVPSLRLKTSESLTTMIQEASTTTLVDDAVLEDTAEVPLVPKAESSPGAADRIFADELPAQAIVEAKVSTITLAAETASASSQTPTSVTAVYSFDSPTMSKTYAALPEGSTSLNCTVSPSVPTDVTNATERSTTVNINVATSSSSPPSPPPTPPPALRVSTTPAVSAKSAALTGSPTYNGPAPLPSPQSTALRRTDGPAASSNGTRVILPTAAAAGVPKVVEAIEAIGGGVSSDVQRGSDMEATSTGSSAPTPIISKSSVVTPTSVTTVTAKIKIRPAGSPAPPPSTVGGLWKGKGRAGES